MHRECGIGHERPRRRRPDENSAAPVPGALLPAPAALQLQGHVNARILRVLVSLRELVARQRRAAPRAVRQDLVPAIQQPLVEHRAQRPPHTLDVVVVVRDVWMLVIQPIADPRAQPLPVRPVREHAVAAAPIELRHAERLDLLLAADPELLLHFDLDREAVSVPARLSCDTIALHRPVSAEEILDRAREHVVDAWASVRRRRTFKEHERRRILACRQRLREELLVLPARKQFLLHVVGRTVRRERLVARHARRRHKRSRTPRTTAVRSGSVRFATAMTRSTVSGSSASGRHRSVMIDRPRTRMPPCTATSTSGTVDIPTTSAPMSRRNRYSARVSRFGPATHAYTPS